VVVNVVTAQDGHWSVNSKVAFGTIGVILVVSLLLFAIYNFYLLQTLKRQEASDVD